MRKIFTTIVATGMSLSLMSPLLARAEDDPIAQEEVASEGVKDHAEWKPALMEKYSLTEDQMKSLHDQGFNYPQIGVIGQLAQSSGKTVEEIAKLRSEEKLGWGKIAKDLGVAPGEIGKSIAALRHERIEQRKEKHEEKKAVRETRREARREARADRREMRAGKKARQ
jgi:hypothetical protein